MLGEGAGTLVLESLEHAQARGARIHAELVGFASNSDGTHVTHPNPETMAKAMRMALADAGLQPRDIGYVNAHGTATDQGDVAESLATHAVFGDQVPVSTLKGYMGHTLGASGALEAWMTLEMMREGWFAANANLEQPDARCAPLDYIMGSARQAEVDYVMSNNFAFGGINTSLIFQRWRG
ncbi:3-oxoacyl-[acyl-carrier-protein] synthase 2 [compost metagenome]